MVFEEKKIISEVETQGVTQGEGDSPNKTPYLRSQSIDYERQINENQLPSSRSLSSLQDEELKLNAFKK